MSQSDASQVDALWSARASAETQYIEFQPRTLMAEAYYDAEVEAPANAVGDLPVDFNAGTITSYAGAGQDIDANAFAIEDGGETLRLSGNTWKKTELPAGLVIEADTVLRVTFELVDGISSKIHAIGLDDNSSLGGGPLFQFAGSFVIAGVFTPGGSLEYPGGAVTYDIPLGEFAGQDFNFLTFISDDDGGFGSEAVFSDISFVTPSAGGNTAPTTAPIDAGVALESDAAVDIDLLAGAVDAEGDALTVSGVTATDQNGAAVAIAVIGSVATVDPAQFAAALNAGDQAVVTVAYDIEDGNGGVTPNTATLVIDGEGPPNSAPTTSPIDAGAVNESDAPTDIDLLAGAVDADGDRIRQIRVTEGVGQSLELQVELDVVDARRGIDGQNQLQVDRFGARGIAPSDRDGDEQGEDDSAHGSIGPLAVQTSADPVFQARMWRAR